MTKNLEWLDEPNKLEWIYEGYECVILRDPKYGNLCGYVGLKSGHPWYGKETGDREIYDIDVHGQISWTSIAHPTSNCDYKCNYFVTADKKLWWLGFEEATGKDFRPFAEWQWANATYKNIEFIKAECEKLVRQCKEAACNDLKNIMLQIIDHGYAAFDTYSRGSGGGVRPRYDNLKLIQANNMLIDMVKWGKFRAAEKKPYTCECKYAYSNYGPGLIIGVCEKKDPENIRLCKLATKIWDKTSIINTKDFSELNTELRALVFKTLAEDANVKI